MNPLFATTAVIEAATGLALIAAPEFVVRLLLGAELAGAGVPLGRLTGVALLSSSRGPCSPRWGFTMSGR